MYKDQVGCEISERNIETRFLQEKLSHGYMLTGLWDE